MKYTSIFKRQSFIIVISIITISVIIIGASYALFVSNHQGEDQTLSAGTLSATFTEDTIISANLVPLSDADALAATDNVYTFSLSNTGSLAMEYKLTLSNYLDGVNDSNMLAHKYIKIKFDDETPVYLDSLTKVDSSKTNENEIVYVIKTNVINSGVSNESHTIRIWISDTDSSGAETEESIIGKTIGFKIGLEGKATDSKVTLANYVKGLYTVQGAGGLYLHDSGLENGANDGSYRYAGANPNNYVCFGSDETPCPADNVYRIIGVFGEQVKLIKSTSLDNMAWDSNYVGTWSSTSLNIYLNGEYLTSLGAWADKIVSYDWVVGGMKFSSTNTSKQYYDVEIPKSGGIIYNAKIGLMYVSDYGFAATPNYWTTGLYSYESAKSSDWLNIGIYEWTISRDSGDLYYTFYVCSTGVIDSYDVLDSYGVRPSFYLDSKVTYEGGSGSAGDPMKIG